MGIAQSLNFDRVFNPTGRSVTTVKPSDMNDFSLRDLQTNYLPPYVSIMLKGALL